jgi:hypothetical protein
MSVMRSEDDKNSPYVVMKDDQLFPKDRLLLLLERIVQSQRDFWK